MPLFVCRKCGQKTAPFRGLQCDPCDSDAGVKEWCDALQLNAEGLFDSDLSRDGVEIGVEEYLS